MRSLQVQRPRARLRDHDRRRGPAAAGGRGLKKKKPRFFALLAKRSSWFETRPELFPDVYGDVSRRMPDRRVRKHNHAIMKEHFGVMDLQSRRCGTPKADGSVFGLSEKSLAIRTGLGDPRVKYESGHWRGRRTVQRRIAQLRHGKCLTWGKPEWWKKGSACNPRFKIETGPKAGTWRLYPAVRVVTMDVIRALQLDQLYALELQWHRERLARGQVAPCADLQLRRARDREIKFRSRERKRHQLVLEREQAIAAKTVRRQL